MRFLLAAFPLLLAAPLQAQIWAPPGNGLPRTPAPVTVSPPAEPLHHARGSIRDGRREGELSRAEARHFKRQQRILSAISERYAADGLSPGEAADLDFRARALDQRVQAARALGRAKR